MIKTAYTRTIAAVRKLGVFELKIEIKPKTKIGRESYEGAPRPRVDFESNLRLGFVSILSS